MGFKCETKLRKKCSGHETHGVLPNKCVNLIGAVIDGLAYENIDAQILLPAGSRLPSADPYAGTDAGKNVPTSACPLIVVLAGGPNVRHSQPLPFERISTMTRKR